MATAQAKTRTSSQPGCTEVYIQLNLYIKSLLTSKSNSLIYT